MNDVSERKLLTEMLQMELSCAGWSSPNNYARFPNGLQICWGRANFPPTSTGGQEITVTFPKAFSSVPTVMMSWQDSTNVGSYMEKGTLTALSSTTATVLHAWANRINATSNWWANYLAIGPWR